MILKIILWWLAYGSLATLITVKKSENILDKIIHKTSGENSDGNLFFYVKTLILISAILGGIHVLSLNEVRFLFIRNFLKVETYLRDIILYKRVSKSFPKFSKLQVRLYANHILIIYNNLKIYRLKKSMIDLSEFIDE